jgi:ribosomal protein S14
MPLRDLSPDERETVRTCVRAAAEGPFFPDEEFQTIFGLSREQVREVAERWSVNDESDEAARLAINNALNNLLGYPHGCEQEWPRYVPVSEAEVARLLRKYRGDQSGSYFDNLM